MGCRCSHLSEGWGPQAEEGGKELPAPLPGPTLAALGSTWPSAQWRVTVQQLWTGSPQGVEGWGKCL